MIILSACNIQMVSLNFRKTLWHALHNNSMHIMLWMPSGSTYTFHQKHVLFKGCMSIKSDAATHNIYIFSIALVLHLHCRIKMTQSVQINKTTLLQTLHPNHLLLYNCSIKIGTLSRNTLFYIKGMALIIFFKYHSFAWEKCISCCEYNLQWQYSISWWMVALKRLLLRNN